MLSNEIRSYGIGTMKIIRSWKRRGQVVGQQVRLIFAILNLGHAEKDLIRDVDTGSL